MTGVVGGVIVAVSVGAAVTVGAGAAVVALDTGWAAVVAAGVLVASLLCAATVSLLPVQLTQSNKKKIRTTSCVVGACGADKKWCNRFTGTNLLELLRFGVWSIQEINRRPTAAQFTQDAVAYDDFLGMACD